MTVPSFSPFLNTSFRIIPALSRKWFFYRISEKNEREIIPMLFIFEHRSAALSCGREKGRAGV
jgi:hypothetical protein